MIPDPIVLDLAGDLRSRHRCHTVILYGSRAAGDARPESDYDIAGFGTARASYRDARKWRGHYIDAFVHPEAKLLDPPRDFLGMRGGVVLFEKDGGGTRLLGKLEEMFAAGPEKLRDDEIAALKVWAWKMLDRAAASDIDGDYRRTWLLMALLEDYFAIRHRWYLGPKRSFNWLAANEPAVHAAFEEALRPGASMEVVRKLVERVAGPPP